MLKYFQHFKMTSDGRTQFFICIHCGTTTLRSLATSHYCTKTRDGHVYNPGDRMAAAQHLGYRSQLQVVSLEELRNHLKSFGEYSIVKGCCSKAIILALGYCGTLVELPNISHRRFEPTNGQVYNLMEHNLLFNGKLQWNGCYNMNNVQPLTPFEVTDDKLSAKDFHNRCKATQSDLLVLPHNHFSPILIERYHHLIVMTEFISI